MATKRATSRPSKRPRRLGVAGIKSIRDYTEIDLAPLTILAGANSSGKSSMMQTLLMIKQTLEAAYDPGPLLIQGANTSFSSVSEMLWHAPGQQSARELVVSYSDEGGERTAVTFRAAAKGIDLVSQTYRARDQEKEFELTRKSAQAVLRDAIPMHLRVPLKDLIGSEGLALKRSRSFFQVSLASIPVPLRSADSFIKAATSLIHLPGLRGLPERFYPATEVGDVYPGVFQPYVASIIASWGNQKDERLTEVGKQLARLGLSWKVEAKRLDDTRVALMVGRLPVAKRGGARDLVNIADVGLGVSQTLPILVALLAAKRGQIVFLEQPEIHLHPRAQVALAPIILEGAQRGVFVIVETHSNLLLRALQERVALEAVPDDLVRLHWFSRTEAGVTHVDSAHLDENGSFGDWPVDFADVELDIEDRYLDAAMGH